MLCHFVNCNWPLKEYSTPCSQCLQLLYCSDACQSAQVTLHGQHCQNLAPNFGEDIIEHFIEEQRNLFSYISTFGHLVVRHALSVLGFSDLGQGVNIQDIANTFQHHTRYDYILVIKLLKDPASHLYHYPRWSKLTFSIAYVAPTSPHEKLEIQNLLTGKPASSLVIAYHTMDSMVDLYSQTNHPQYYVHIFEQPPSAIPIVSLRHLTSALFRCEEALLHNDDQGDDLANIIAGDIYSGEYYDDQQDFSEDAEICVPEDCILEDGSNDESDSSDDYTIHTPDPLF